MQRVSFTLILLTTLALGASAQPALSQPVQPKTAETGDSQPAATASVGFQKSNDPIYIKSDTLTLNNLERHFTYSGSVEVKQGDLTIYCQNLDGSYDEKNQIQELIATKQVQIIKGPEIRANGGRATYNKATETLILTENPEMLQNNNVLSADLIRIFLEENRSSAEGQVRVKLVKQDKKI